MPRVHQSWRGRLGVLAVLTLGVVVAQSGARADSQDLITIQARITHNGAPLDGSLALTFEIWDAATSGTLLWGPEAQTVSVGNGILSARLGGGTPPLGNLFKPGFHTTTERWVAIKLDGDEIVPRIHLTAVPYAQGASAATVASEIWTTTGNLTISGLDLRYLEHTEIGDGLEYVSNKLRLDDASGGAGLTWTTGELAVGQGNGITVAADAVAANLGTGLEFDGSGGIRLGSAAAGTGLNVTAGVLSVDPADLLQAGSAEINGDRLDVDYTAAHYNPDTTGTDATANSQLAAHLKGIDDELDALATSGGGGGAVDPDTSGGRLTLSPQVSPLTSMTILDPVSTADVTSSILYYVPCTSAKIALYDDDDDVWEIADIGTGIFVGIAHVVADQNYDVFAYKSGSDVALELLTWTNHGANTSARTALSKVNGVWVRTSDNEQRYLGTIRAINSSGVKFCDTASQRFVWNARNRVGRSLVATYASSWSYNSTTYRAAGTVTTVGATRVEFVQGLNEDAVVARVNVVAENSTALCGVATGIGISSTNTNSAQVFGAVASPDTRFSRPESHYQGCPAIGYQFLQWLESSENLGTTYWYGALLGGTYGLVAEIQG